MLFTIAVKVFGGGGTFSEVCGASDARVSGTFQSLILSRFCPAFFMPLACIKVQPRECR